MRLGALLLTAAALAAPPVRGQGRPALPWERLQPMDWQAAPGVMKDEPTPEPQPSTGPVAARVTGDGTLQVIDGRAIIRLQAGLPGRPLRAWRDGGVALPTASGTWLFPVDAPMSLGLGGLRWGADDFRPYLRGLLWLLEDGEGFLTVVHPGTARLIHLPLPPGRDLRLRFLADRLEVTAGVVDKGAPRQWSIPWMGLLPRLAALGPRPDPPKAGTALAPFPRE